VPGTILTSLLRNGTFSNSSSSSSTATTTSSNNADPASEAYIDDNLSNIPDINATGVEVMFVAGMVYDYLFQQK
jgi:hypothetical protein